ncbi:MAG: alpha-L-fucosidase [Phycisphaerales bacterium]|nr:alpha-L-fucosidase [Phycisphaerales bacterium]
MCALMIGSLAMQSPPPQPSAKQADLDRRMGWFRDARFGMFIHCGLYAIPGGQWQGKEVGGAGEWILQTARIPPAEYMPLITQFNPVEFNADEWVRIAKMAGQKYIVITSKHHEGFALWDSRVSTFDVMGTPFKRDILKELADACARGGIKLCFYHSIMDWTHCDYLPKREWDARKEEDADFDRYVGYMKEQLRELVSGKYGKIGILWFDGEWEPSWTHERGLELARYVRALDPDIIINNRVDKGRNGMAGLNGAGDWAGDYGTPEQEIPATGLAGTDWETCMTMNDTWGWKATDKNWKSAANMIQMLCDIASKGGNFLLNVGSQPDGRIPAESIERLAQIGAWMETNGEAIYGSSASPFANLPWGRCTQKQLPQGRTRLYLHVFEWPKSADGKSNTLIMPALTNEIVAVRLLGATSFASSATRSGDGWSISIPLTPSDPVCSVIAIDIVGRPLPTAAHSSK